MATGTKDGRPPSTSKRGTRSARTSARGTPARRGGRGTRGARAATKIRIGSTGKKPEEHLRLVLLDADEVRKIVRRFGGKYLAFKVVVEPPRPTGRAMKMMKGSGDGSDDGKKTTILFAIAPTKPGTE